MSERRSIHLAVYMNPTLRAALGRAAEHRFTTVSEFARQAIIEKMRADGTEPTTSTTSTSSSPVEQVA